MTNVNTDPAADALVRAYLDRLQAAAWNLPPERRDELLAEVREHIDAALVADPQGGPEVAARNVLDRLGPPEEIVRAESEGMAYAGARRTRPGSKQPWGGLEIAAVVTLGDRRHPAPGLRPAGRARAGLVVVPLDDAAEGGSPRHWPCSRCSS